MQTSALPAPAATPHARDFYARKRANRKCLCTRSAPHRDPAAGRHMDHIRCLKCGYDASHLVPTP